MSESAPKTKDLTDFPDGFSPMLVKELRQGLRTNLFVTAFILLQGFMILCILMGSAESSSTDASSAFFWFFIIVALVVVQPLRGFGSLSGEYNLNTMDLIQLTRLDAWKITCGKWFAINAQTLLLVAAVAPYLVLRYFFGNINVFADLGALALCTIGSALLSAMTVGCSAFKNLVVRLASLVGAGFLFIFLWAYTKEELLKASVGASEIKQIALLIFASVFGIVYFLSFGATRIAPGSVNLSTAKRLFGVACAIVAWSFQLFGTDDEVCNVIASIILGLTLMDALTEDPPIFESVLKPFTPPLKRPLAWLLTPGWHTGILFFILVYIVLWIPLIYFHSGFNPDIDEIGLAVFGAGLLSFPLLIIHLFFRKSSMPKFALYLFIQACLLVVTVLSLAVADNPSVNDDVVYMITPLPSVFLFASLGNDTEAVFVTIGLVLLIASLLIPLLFGRGLFVSMSKVLKNNPGKD